MEVKDWMILVFLLFILIVPGVFTGSMIRQYVEGQMETLSGVELSILLASFMLCVQLVILLKFRKKKDTENVAELALEARKITY